jgi:hypothetical protein
MVIISAVLEEEGNVFKIYLLKCINFISFMKLDANHFYLLL